MVIWGGEGLVAQFCNDEKGGGHPIFLSQKGEVHSILAVVARERGVGVGWRESSSLLEFLIPFH